jgi:hypothetical protein
VKARFGRVWIEGEGFKPAIVFEGRRRLSAVIQRPKVVVRRIPRDSQVDELPGSLAKAASQFRGSARRNGSTKEARRLLKGL